MQTEQLPGIGVPVETGLLSPGSDIPGPRHPNPGVELRRASPEGSGMSTFAVWDIDAGRVILWLVRNGVPERGWGGGARRNGSRPRTRGGPSSRMSIRYSGFIFSPDFWESELADVEFVLCEKAHIVPRGPYSKAQMFEPDEVSSYFRALESIGAVPLAVRHTSARWARRNHGFSNKDASSPKWWSEETDAYALAVEFAGWSTFRNLRRLRDEPAHPRNEYAIELRAPVQDEINKLRNMGQAYPDWMYRRVGSKTTTAPPPVTRALACIIETYPDKPWSWVKTTFRLHGTSGSGLGQKNVVRSEVANRGAAFIRQYKWAGVHTEFDRLKCFWNEPNPGLVKVPEKRREIA